jgi:hypothetical protein
MLQALGIHAPLAPPAPPSEESPFPEEPPYRPGFGAFLPECGQPPAERSCLAHFRCGNRAPARHR